MFEWSKNLCNKLKDADCLSAHELEMIEISLRLYECYTEVLNENLGLDLRTKEANFFQLEHAIHRNREKEMV